MWLEPLFRLSCNSRATRCATSSTIWSGTGGMMLHRSFSLLLPLSEARVVEIDADTAQLLHSSEVQNVQPALRWYRACRRHNFKP